MSLYLFDTSNIASFAYPNTRDVITIGPNDYDDIKIAELSNVIMIKNYAEIGQTGYVQFVHNDDSKLYINYELSNDKWSRAYIGDHVFINGIWFEVQSDGLKMMSHETMISDLIRLNQDTPDAQSDDYNDYHRSPESFIVNLLRQLKLKTATTNSKE